MEVGEWEAGSAKELKDFLANCWLVYEKIFRILALEYNYGDLGCFGGFG
jgi:hypothetical protein